MAEEADNAQDITHYELGGGGAGLISALPSSISVQDGASWRPAMRQLRRARGADTARMRGYVGVG